MSTGPAKGRGGARKGTGPKPKQVDKAFLDEVHAAIEKKAKEHHQTIGEVIVGMAYDPSNGINQRHALKLIVDLMKGNAPKVDEEIKRVGPVVLPAKRPDPASVPLEKKVDGKKVANG